MSKLIHGTIAYMFLNIIICENFYQFLSSIKRDAHRRQLVHFFLRRGVVLRASIECCSTFSCRTLYGRYAADIYSCYYQYAVTPHSVIPRLKPSVTANPFHHRRSFLLRTDSTDSPECLLLLLSISVFFCFTLFSCWFRAVD